MTEGGRKKPSQSKLDVDHVAHLARLDLTEAERTTLGPQLLKILDYVDQLQQLDTRDVEATFQVLPRFNVLRDDVVAAGLSREDALSNAPQREGGYFRVPRIL